ARRRARGPGDADHRHAELLADRREVFGDQPDAEDADGPAGEQVRRLAVPGAAVLRTYRARHVARERQHEGDGGLRYRRAVNAADIGDDHFLAERGEVDDVVDARAQRLDPFQLRRVSHDM